METATVGEVFRTVIVRVPPVSTSDIEINAFNRVLLTYSVDRLDPLHRTVELLLKFLPFTVRVKLPLPAETLSGEIDVIDGDVLGVTVGGEEEPPPQFRINKPLKTRTAGIKYVWNKHAIVGCFSGLPNIAM